MTTEITKVTRVGAGALNPKHLQFGCGFPAQWGFCQSDGQGGEPPKDAGTIHFTVGQIDEEIYDDGVTVSVTLQQLMEDIFDSIASGVGESRHISEADHIADAKRIVAALRAAADWLDGKCGKPFPQPSAPQ